MKAVTFVIWRPSSRNLVPNARGSALIRWIAKAFDGKKLPRFPPALGSGSRDCRRLLGSGVSVRSQQAVNLRNRDRSEDSGRRYERVQHAGTCRKGLGHPTFRVRLAPLGRGGWPSVSRKKGSLVEPRPSGSWRLHLVELSGARSDRREPPFRNAPNRYMGEVRIS